MEVNIKEVENGWMLTQFKDKKRKKVYVFLNYEDVILTLDEIFKIEVVEDDNIRINCSMCGYNLSTCQCKEIQKMRERTNDQF